MAWEYLGWKPAGFAEIEPFPSEVLAHHYPGVKNYGDVTQYKEWDIGTIKLLVGGSPCQSFSVAGLRKGLEDPRGNLMLTYGAIAGHFKPAWIVWENVPGVLSSDGGRDFGTFLGMLAELGYGFAYRVLDAQYFGVPQRRRRVFVVGYLGDWRPAAEVLFESESMQGYPAPSREARKGAARDTAQCFEPRSPDGYARLIGDIAPTLNTMGGGQREPCVVKWPAEVAGTLDAHYGDKMGLENQHVFNQHASRFVAAQPKTISMATKQISQNIGDNIATPIMATDYKEPQAVFQQMQVRRITPTECERLQGFPDGYTDIKDKTPDGPRYKALGNSMAVPVMRWIGERIQTTNKAALA